MAGELYDTYPAIRAVALRLAIDGWHVIRFDYYGTGESGGVFTDGSLAGWVEDASMVSEELRDASGKRNVTVLGVRAGALVAAGLAAHQGGIDHMVFWDPVVEPSEYMKTLNTEFEAANPGVPAEWPDAPDAEARPLGNFLFTPALAREILASRVAPGAWRSTRRLTVVSTVSSPTDFESLRSEAEDASLEVRTVHSPLRQLTPAGMTSEPDRNPLDDLVAALR